MSKHLTFVSASLFIIIRNGVYIYRKIILLLQLRLRLSFKNVTFPPELPHNDFGSGIFDAK